MKEYLETSTIQEADRGVGADQMVAQILNDFETLMEFMIEAIEASNKIGDTSTTDMITKMMKRMEKRHWMLTAFSKNNWKQVSRHQQILTSNNENEHNR